MPVLATYFTVRRGRDPFFKFFMRTLFPRQVREYEQKFGIKFLGWYNVAHGWDFDNAILLPAPSATEPGSGCSSAITRCSCGSGWARTWSTTATSR